MKNIVLCFDRARDHPGLRGATNAEALLRLLDESDPLESGVEILEYPTMLHAKAFVRDDEDVLVGTCNLEAWSLRRFFEIDVLVRSAELAEQFEERFTTPAIAVSSPGRAVSGARERLRTGIFAAISPLL